MRSSNFIPGPLGDRFLSDLIDLVDKVAVDHGFKGKYLQSELLTKFCDSSTTPPEVRRTAAVDKWLAAEVRNRKTNQRLLIDEFSIGWTSPDLLMDRIRGIIATTLGPIEVARLTTSSHTNGASTRVPRTPLGSTLKHSGRAHGTSAALLQWSLCTGGTVLEDQEVMSVAGSSVFTVPKRSDIDRVACKEPEINLFLQRAVGDHIRGRLRRAGVDLNNQQINQELARTALSRGLATIDLSSASDSISVGLVHNLLPYEWFRYLNDIRSPAAKLDEEYIEFEMFSSMGNGFTFELESLIFWAITRAVCWCSGVNGRVNVYGDDIIAPARIVPRLKRVFDWLGFKLNLEKTFWRGPFRESCGKHYHNSCDVTPFYVREPVRQLTDMIRLLNRLMEWDGRNLGFITDESVFEFHRKWSNHIPEALWGGQNPDDITSLVTGHPPRKRLVRKSKDLLAARPELAGPALLNWFATREGTSSPDGLEINAKEQGRWTIGKQPAFLVRTTWTPWLVFTESQPNP